MSVPRYPSCAGIVLQFETLPSLRRYFLTKPACTVSLWKHGLNSPSDRRKKKSLQQALLRIKRLRRVCLAVGPDRDEIVAKRRYREQLGEAGRQRFVSPKSSVSRNGCQQVLAYCQIHGLGNFGAVDTAPEKPWLLQYGCPSCLEEHQEVTLLTENDYSALAA